MATVMIPTMRASVNPNPKGSATTHVTMAAANPFERTNMSVREANQPLTYSMLPGLGGDISVGTTKTATAAPASSTSSSGWAAFGQNLAQSLITNIGVPLLQQEVIKQPTVMSGAKAVGLTAPGMAPVQSQPIIIQQPASSMSMTPVVIGVLGLVAVGAIFMMKRKKG